MNDKDGADILVRPPVLLVFFISAGALVNTHVPLRFSVDQNARLFPGWVLLVVALGLAAWSLVIFFRAGQNPDPVTPTESLYADGPYSWSRNPMYLAMFLLQAGLALLLNDLWIMIMIPAMFVSIHFGVVLREEAYLRNKFGAKYSDYTARVRRYV